MRSIYYAVISRPLEQGLSSDLRLIRRLIFVIRLVDSPLNSRKSVLSHLLTLLSLLKMVNFNTIAASAALVATVVALPTPQGQFSSHSHCSPLIDFISPVPALAADVLNQQAEAAAIADTFLTTGVYPAVAAAKRQVTVPACTFNGGNPNVAPTIAVRQVGGAGGNVNVAPVITPVVQAAVDVAAQAQGTLRERQVGGAGGNVSPFRSPSNEIEF